MNDSSRGGSLNPPNPSGSGPSRPNAKTTSGRRLNRELVALSSAAILVVFGMGFARTESAAEQLSAKEQSTGLTAAAPASASLASSAPRPVVAATPTTVTIPGAPATSPRPGLGATAPVAATIPPTPTPTAAVSSRYRDGQYTAWGYSRHGNVQATVVIQAGKIISADVVGCTTRYPCSDIDGLPGQVVSSQDPNQVDFVSGASDSSQAYLTAVATALQQATG